MHPSTSPKQPGIFERMTGHITTWLGSVYALMIAALIIVVWAATGPFFHFGDTWQLIINTGTTIVTFLMVFIIQRSQNKDTVALHLKLNEILAALKGASTRLINVEDLSEEEVRKMHARFDELADRCKEGDQSSRSVEEVEPS